MIGDLKAYPAMKDSGVAWLGKVPKHWEVSRLRNVVDMRVSNVDKHTKEEELPVRLCNYVDVYKNDRITDRISFMSATATFEEIARFRLEIDDVLITKDSESWSDIGVPTLVEYTAPDLVCGYHLALLRPFRELIMGSYLFRAMQSPTVSYQCHVEANGVTRFGLSHAGIKSLSLPLPPLHEQSAIVRFLDYADRRIRRHISAKQKLIKLLEEQRQAIIHRAVTRGLDPNVPLKPSGVEWLGDIPEHWDRRAVWQIFELGRGKVMSHEYVADHPGPYPLYSSQTENEGVMGYIDTYMFDGDYLTWTTDGAHAGTVFRRDGRFNCTNVCGTLRPKELVDLGFMRMAIASETKRQVRLDINPKLMNNMMARIRVNVPPLEEQVHIASHVERMTKPIEMTRASFTREISLLREYRTRLIADVVTGKLDVREAAARLPDESDEPEPPEETDALADAEDPAADDLDPELEEAEA